MPDGPTPNCLRAERCSVGGGSSCKGEGCKDHVSFSVVPGTTGAGDVKSGVKGESLPSLSMLMISLASDNAEPIHVSKSDGKKD